MLQPQGACLGGQRGAVSVPAIEDGRLTWTLDVAPDRELAVRAVLAWDTLARQSSGRLRPCANEECRLFLIDAARPTPPGGARWPSAATG